VRKTRIRPATAVLAAALVVAGMWAPAAANAVEADLGITAFLDGKPIPLENVGKYYCDDFSFPVINCSSEAGVIEARTSSILAATAVDYVTVYENPGLSGAWMHVSQDYSQLWQIGWNDRISSFRGRNSGTGKFWTDWFYGGSFWSFCCNQQVTTLGGWDNTFSSVHRT
jgi:hypothetical protein